MRKQYFKEKCSTSHFSLLNNFITGYNKLLGTLKIKKHKKFWLKTKKYLAIKIP